MGAERRQLSLGAFLMNYGHHIAAWRHPGSAGVGAVDYDFYKRCAQAAERGNSIWYSLRTTTRFR